MILWSRVVIQVTFICPQVSIQPSQGSSPEMGGDWQGSRKYLFLRSWNPKEIFLSTRWGRHIENEASIIWSRIARNKGPVILSSSWVWPYLKMGHSWGFRSHEPMCLLFVSSRLSKIPDWCPVAFFKQYVVEITWKQKNRGCFYKGSISVVQTAYCPFIIS